MEANILVMEIAVTSVAKALLPVATIIALLRLFTIVHPNNSTVTACVLPPKAGLVQCADTTLTEPHPNTVQAKSREGHVR